MSLMPRTPDWQRLVVDAEQAVAPHLRSVLHNDDVLLALAVMHAVRGHLARRAEHTTRRLLHLLNLPAGSDINRLLTHIASLERQVRELTESLEHVVGTEEVTHRAANTRRSTDPAAG